MTIQQERKIVIYYNDGYTLPQISRAMRLPEANVRKFMSESKLTQVGGRKKKVNR